MKNFKSVIAAYLILISFLALSQTSDTNKVNSLNIITESFYRSSNLDSAFKYGNESKSLSEKILYKKGLAKAEHLLGNIFYTQGNYPDALNKYFMALRINEEIKNDYAAITQLTNIGNIYAYKGDKNKSIYYCSKALDLSKKIGDKKLTAISLVNLGSAYIETLGYEKALTCFLNANDIYTELGDKDGSYACVANIGLIYDYKKDYVQSLNYYFKSLNLIDTSNKPTVSAIYGNISGVYFLTNKLSEAKKYSLKSNSIANEIGSLELIRTSCKQLSEIYDRLGNKSLAFDYYKKYTQAKDSLINEENTKNIVRSEMNFEFEKQKAISKSEQEKKDAIAISENHRQRVVIFSVILLAIMLIGFLLVMYNRFKVIKKQKHIIEIQKDEVLRQKHIVEKSYELLDEKNKEVMASIRYAQRIQQSLLTSEKYIQNSLNRLIKN